MKAGAQCFQCLAKQVTALVPSEGTTESVADCRGPPRKVEDTTYLFLLVDVKVWPLSPYTLAQRMCNARSCTGFRGVAYGSSARAVFPPTVPASTDGSASIDWVFWGSGCRISWNTKSDLDAQDNSLVSLPLDGITCILAIERLGMHSIRAKPINRTPYMALVSANMQQQCLLALLPGLLHQQAFWSM